MITESPIAEDEVYISDRDTEEVVTIEWLKGVIIKLQKQTIDEYRNAIQIQGYYKQIWDEFSHKQQVTPYIQIEKNMISLNEMDSNSFQSSDGRLTFILTSAFKQFFEEQWNVSTNETGTYYLNGPRGIGKSHTIVLLTVQLRMTGTRVLYINRLSEFLLDPINFLRKEIMYFMGEDLQSITIEDLGLKNAEFWREQKDLEGAFDRLRISSDSSDLSKLLQFLFYLISYYNKQLQPIWLIVDQSKQEFISHHNYDKFSIVQDLFQKVLIGESEFYLEGYLYHQDFRLRITKSFTLIEAYRFIAVRISSPKLGELQKNEVFKEIENKAEEKIKRIMGKFQNEKRDEIKQSNMPKPTLVTLQKQVKTVVEELTGYHPYELHLLMKEVRSTNSWDLGIEKFQINRYGQVQDYLQAKLRKSEEIQAFYDLVVHLSLDIQQSGIWLTKHKESLWRLANENFFFIKDEKCHFQSSTVGRCIYRFLIQKTEFKKVLDGKFGLYLAECTQIKKNQAHHISARRNLFLYLEKRRGKQCDRLQFEFDSEEGSVQIPANVQLHYFQYKLYDLDPYNLNVKDILERKMSYDYLDICIPIASNFPYVDFIFVVHKDKKLRLIFVQVTENISSHEKSDDEVKKRMKQPGIDKFSIALSDMPKDLPYEFYWIGNYTSKSDKEGKTIALKKILPDSKVILEETFINQIINCFDMNFDNYE